MAYGNQLQHLPTAAQDARQQLLAKSLAYYDGDQPKSLLKTKPGGPDDNTAVNYAAVIVDKGVSFLFGAELDIEIGDENDEAGEANLEELWPEDLRHVDLIELATNGAIFGHAWAKLVLDNGRPSVSVLDPLNLSAEWDSRDYRRVMRYRNQYNTTDEAGNPIVWREDTERDGAAWAIKEYWSRPDMSGWTLVSTTAWPWPFAPVFECKNLPKANEYYGRADLSKYVLHLCYYLARTDSLINRIIRAHASPKPIAQGIAEQDLKTGTDDVLYLPSPDQKLSLLEMTGDLAGALAFRKQLREALAEVSQVPEIATGKMESLGQLSGLALKILYGPLVDRTTQKRRLYGRLIKSLVRALFVIAGQAEPRVELHWPQPVPGDDVEAANVALLKKQIGVSADTLLREMGYDAEKEIEKSADEAEEALARQERAFNRGQGNEL